MEKYSRTFTTFGGSDCIAVLNNETIGEWQGYEFTEKLGVILDDNGNPTNKKSFIGSMEISVFDREPSFRTALKKEGNEFTLFFATEYGQKASVHFKNIKFTERKGGISIDDIFMTEKYFFECDEHYISRQDWVSELGSKVQFKFVEGEPNA